MIRFIRKECFELKIGINCVLINGVTIYLVLPKITYRLRYRRSDNRWFASSSKNVNTFYDGDGCVIRTEPCSPRWF